MYAQELLVHDCCKGKRTKRVHASFIDRFGILVLAFKLERKVIRQVSTFMVPSEQPQGIWIPNLERPKVQDALRSLSVNPEAICKAHDLPLY